MIQKHVYLNEEINQKLTEYSKKTGQTVSSIIKNLIIELLKKEGM